MVIAMLDIQFENKRPKQLTCENLKTGDIFRFKDSLWGRSNDELFLVTSDAIIDLKKFEIYDRDFIGSLFNYNSFYGDDDDWGDFLDNVYDNYEIEIFDADIILKKVIDR